MTPITQIIITEDEFIEHYRPLPNTLDENASFDCGEGGCLYETYGPELEYVMRQPAAHIWTMIDGEETTLITSGYRLVNRIGYIIAAHPRESDAIIDVVLD